MKKTRVLALVVALLMCMVVFAGCASGGTEEPAAEEPAAEEPAAEEPAAEEPAAEEPAAEEPAAEEPAAEEPAEEEPAASGEKHEIYSYLPNSALSGIVDPDMPSRADIDKAWPKTPKDPENIVIGYSAQNQDNDWFIGVNLAAQAICDEKGFTLNFMQCDNDANTQSQHIDTFITQDVDIIVVDPVTVSGPVEDIKRAVEAGIPVVCIGTVPDDCPIITTMTPNPFMVGFETGKYIASQFAADEDIVSALIIGRMGSSASESRLCGMLSGVAWQRMEDKGTPYAIEEDAYLAGFNMFGDVQASGTCELPDGGFKVVAWGTGEWTIEGGLAAAEDIVTAHGSELNLIMPDNDFMGLGTETAVSNAGLSDQIMIGCPADGTAEGMDLVKDGKLVCTGTFSGPQTGANSIWIIDDLFNGGLDGNNLPMGTYFAYDAITAENVDQYYPTDTSNWDGKFYTTPAYERPLSIDEIRAEAGL